MLKKIKKVMLWFIIINCALIAAALSVGYHISTPNYKGKQTLHFDGNKFTNPGNNPYLPSFTDFLKWKLAQNQVEWNEITSQEYAPPPPERVSNGELRITFVNHSTFLLQVGGLNILTDPVWSKRASPFQWAGPKRMRPPGIRFEDLPPIDLVLISHNHYDHLDIPTMKRIVQKHQPKIVAPLGVAQFLTKENIAGATDMDWWDELPLSDSINVICLPAQHFSGRGWFDRNTSLWCGFAIKTAFGYIYFAGDTGYGSFFKEIGERCKPIRLSLLPIGAYRPQWFMSPIHTSPEEAVQIHQDIHSEKSIGIHYGTFRMSDEGMDEPVTDLKKALKAADVSENDFWAMKEGESKTIFLQPQPITSVEYLTYKN